MNTPASVILKLEENDSYTHTPLGHSTLWMLLETLGIFIAWSRFIHRDDAHCLKVKVVFWNCRNINP